MSLAGKHTIVKFVLSLTLSISSQGNKQIKLNSPVVKVGANSLATCAGIYVKVFCDKRLLKDPPEIEVRAVLA